MDNQYKKPGLSSTPSTWTVAETAGEKELPAGSSLIAVGREICWVSTLGPLI